MAPVMAEKLIEVGERKEICRFTMPRQLERGSGYLSVADYFPKAPYTSKVGVLVVEVVDKRTDELDHKDYEYLLRDSLRERFIEAMAQWVMAQVAMGQNIISVTFGSPMVTDHSQIKDLFEFTDVCALLIAHPKALPIVQ